jgi:hypothetical protein
MRNYLLQQKSWRERQRESRNGGKNENENPENPAGGGKDENDDDSPFLPFLFQNSCK